MSILLNWIVLVLNNQWQALISKHIYIKIRFLRKGKVPTKLQAIKNSPPPWHGSAFATVRNWSFSLLARYRCSQGAGLGGGLHVGGKPGQHQLWGESPPWCLCAVVPGRPAAAVGQQLQHQDLQHTDHQLLGGDLDRVSSITFCAQILNVATRLWSLLLYGSDSFFSFPLVKVNPISQNDFGSYNCTATNVMGTESKEFLLISAGVSADYHLWCFFRDAMKKMVFCHIHKIIRNDINGLTERNVSGVAQHAPLHPAGSKHYGCYLWKVTQSYICLIELIDQSVSQPTSQSIPQSTCCLLSCPLRGQVWLRRPNTLHLNIGWQAKTAPFSRAELLINVQINGATSLLGSQSIFNIHTDLMCHSGEA